MKKTTYKAIDLVFFTVITCAVEAVNVLVLRKNVFNEFYSLSVVIVVSLIVYMRWGEWGVIPAVAGALVFALCAGADVKQLVVYGLGNLGVMVASLWTRLLGRKRLKENFLYVTLYALSAFAAVILLRSVIALCFGVSFTAAIVAYAGAEMFNAVIGILILLVAKKQNGILECQDDYLLRIQKEKKEEGGKYDA